ncbi:MAG: hypothetical protein KJ607_13965 [Bacteroidetes bacterium]|nr:hypothetical protein [Bacteroidota bacterium]
MLSKKQIEEIIRHQIDKDEQPGYKSGGSGHLGHISCMLDEVGEPEKTKTGWKVDYTYHTIVETEFTYYPDNPPYVHYYRKLMILDKEAKVLNVTTTESRMDDDKFFEDLIDPDVFNWDEI